jgi:hypothetical protein
MVASGTVARRAGFQALREALRHAKNQACVAASTFLIMEENGSSREMNT